MLMASIYVKRFVNILIVQLFLSVRLRNKGAIRRIGPDNGGHWKGVESKDNSDKEK